MRPSRVQARSWFGTLNNYTDQELAEVREFQNRCEYLAIGFHVGEKSHIPHIHVLVQFKNARGWPKVSNRFHWEIRRGNVIQAVNYLNKESRLEEYGQRPIDRKSRAEEWAEFVQSIHQGTVDKDSILYARYSTYAERRMAELKPRSIYQGDLKDKNLWIVGPAGCGKSRMVHLAFTPDQIHFKIMNKWWDGYHGQRCVLLEDVDPEQCRRSAHFFKVWCDRYPFTGEIKNAITQINPADYHLVVTSNYTIEECFYSNDVAAILRRFEVIQFSSG